MLIKNLLKSTMVLVACVSFAGVGSAQVDPGTVEREASMTSRMKVGATAGYISIQRNNRDSMVYGVLADYEWNERVSVGLSLDYWADDYNLTDQRRVELEDLVLGLNTKILMPVPLMGRDTLKPYVVFGISGHRLAVVEGERARGPGELFLTDTDETDETNDYFGWDAGLGITYSLQQRLEFTAEARYRDVTDADANYDQVTVTGGLAYAF